MSKKQMQALDAPTTDTEQLSSQILATPTVTESDRWVRQTAIEFALQHHKINGGMLTLPQLLDNAKQFHAYITGETK
jgi:hypothetical protein